MMRNIELSETRVRPSLGRFAMRLELAKVALRRLTTGADWKEGRPTDAEFAQHTFDSALFPQKGPFSALDEQATINTSQANTFIRAWRRQRQEAHGLDWKPETAADRLYTAFDGVVAARVLRPQDMNVVAAINAATLEADGPASSYGWNRPIAGDVEAQLDMVRARRQLFDELAQFTRPEDGPGSAALSLQR
jgi:hypothetical protein